MPGPFPQGPIHGRNKRDRQAFPPSGITSLPQKNWLADSKTHPQLPSAPTKATVREPSRRMESPCSPFRVDGRLPSSKPYTAYSMGSRERWGRSDRAHPCEGLSSRGEILCSRSEGTSREGIWGETAGWEMGFVWSGLWWW